MAQKFHHRLEKFVGLEKPPTLAMSVFETAEFTATRVRWGDTSTGHPTQFERADGYMICLQRRDIASQPYWVEGRPAQMAPMARGQFLLLDLTLQHASVTPGNVDCVSIFIARDALLKFEREHATSTVGRLRTPIGTAVDDPVIRSLGEALLPAIHRPHASSQLYADHVALALLSRLTAEHGLDGPWSPPPRRGLAAWQERRAKEMLLDRMDGTVSLAELAAECRLSRSHFARAFKVTTGMSPLRWLAGQRIEKARLLLLNTERSADEIATDCGFTDASHFARCFVRATGTPPGAWRRSRRT